MCREPAVIDVRRQNANYCVPHFVRMCHDQVAKAIAEFSMIRPGERVLVAVSGGKDSLALWDILRALGYYVDGFYVGLGIGSYSDDSGAHAKAYADAIGGRLIERDLRDEYGYDIPTAAKVTTRVPCSACGLSKRHLFDRAARDGGYDVVATGHNLDDEAAVLLGNVLRWQTEYLGRQRPVLAERHGFPRKVKPLVRLGEREMAAYCVVRGIDYIVEECPMAEGNKHLGYKEALNTIETRSPGTKHDFYFGFLGRASAQFTPESDVVKDGLVACDRCGSPTPGTDADEVLCAFCKLVKRAAGAEAVELSPRRGAAGSPRGNGGER